MSLEDLCSRDTVTVTPQTATTGTAFGVTYTDGTPRSVSCCAQELDSKEILDYSARGLNVTHQLFFSADPSISNTDKLTYGGNTLQVKGAFKEGRPGETLLWIVLAESLPTRDR
jgi:hypothetical protein